MNKSNKTIFKLGEWIWLDQGQQVFQIESGEVELYAIDNSDYADGARTFLFDRGAGDYIFSLPPNPIVRLLAIVTTQVNAIFYENWEESSGKEKKQIIEESISFFLGWPPDELYLRQYQEIGPSKLITLLPHENIRVVRGKELYWLEIEPSKFKSSVYGDFMKQGQAVFPVVNKGYLTAVEKAEVIVFTTSEVLTMYDQAFLQSFISLSMDGFYRKIGAYFQENKVAVTERLQQKKTEKELLVYNAYTELMSNLIPDLPVVVTPESKKIPPVINALQLIAEYQGIAKEKIKLDASLGHLVNIHEIIKMISRTTSLHGRKINLGNNWHTSDQGPLLVFQQELPLAAIPITAEKYELVDPSTGQRQQIDNDLAEGLAKEAYTFYVNVPADKYGFWETVKWASKKCFKGDYWAVLWTCIIAGIIPIVTPLITQSVFYDIIPSYDKQAHLMVIQVMLVTTISGGLVNLVRSLSVLRIKNKIRSTMESAIWLKFLALPSAFFRKYQTGDLAMRMQVIEKISTNLTSVISNSLFNGIFSFWYLLVMVYYDAKLSLVALFIWLIYLLLALFFSWRQVKAQRRQVEESGKVAGQTLQILKGLNKFRVAAAEERAFYLWARKFGEEWKWNRKSRWQQNWLELLSQMVPIVMNFFIFWLTIEWIDEGLKNHSSYLIQSNFLAFNSALGGFGSSISGLVSSSTTLWSIKPALERLEPILTAEPEVSENKVPAGELMGNIEFCDVNFRYSPERPLVVNNISLTIKAGQFVAIVGSSGSGKSTLLRLLLGLEKLEKGVILYDDQDLDELDVASVRHQMGVVLQHGQLMSDSIFANIVGSLPLTLDDAWQAAQMVGLADDIRSMPMEMHTVISEGAANISGGQRQRILIARSIVQNPRIIIFDEATSALDNHTQAIVSDTLDKMRATRVIVAHRLSTIKKADVIVVMDQGEIAEKGTYEELMNRNGIFSELAKRQII